MGGSVTRWRLVQQWDTRDFMTAYRDSYNNVYRDGADQQTTIAVGRDKALATMTIKYLHDLSALQVPQIDLAVFAA